ncbi:MAG: DUF790 family protein [Myxococcales bacterium]|nr:DUF790 family protein [Myxococcales bacterium]
MLGPDHVRVRRQGNELILPAFDKKRRARMLELATEIVAIARELEGARRGEIEQSLSEIECRPSERRLLEGLTKLLLDECEMSAPVGVDAAELRREVFERAAEARRGLAPGELLDRAALMTAVAMVRGSTAEQLEEALYADLKSEERVLRVAALPPERLAEQYERAARQAILLRAVRVTADVVCRSPDTYRTLFAKLKFRRLLYQIERTPRGYRIVIDGPHSLFDSVTKYGLALALTLPALEEVDELSLTAELRWGKRREALTYRHQAKGTAADDLAPVLHDEVQALLDAFAEMKTAWQAAPASRIFDVAGLGVCVPDVTFRHSETGRAVHLEVMGYWSRDAVFRRIELSESGLPEPMVFAVSSRLRVSEELLDEGSSDALYVYKGVISARAVERRLDALAARSLR